MRLLKAMHETKRFSPTEQSIIDYVLANPADVAKLTTRDLAEKTFSSPAAVFRLCQKLGLTGYSEFKLKFTSEVNRIAGDEKTVLHRPIKRTDAADIVRKIAAIEIEAIEVFSVGARYVMDVLFSILLSRDADRIEKDYTRFENYIGRLQEPGRRLW